MFKKWKSFKKLTHTNCSKKLVTEHAGFCQTGFILGMIISQFPLEMW
jgi:hypothetical protein